MHSVNFDEVLERILAADTRYPREAYQFVREALDFTQRHVRKKNKDELRHVSGQELLEGVRAFALEQFGPMTLTVFEQWGIRKTEDFGGIVFNMVESGLLSKTDTDTRDDFKAGYDFQDAFRKPFLPRARIEAALPVERPADV